MRRGRRRSAPPSIRFRAGPGPARPRRLPAGRQLEAEVRLLVRPLEWVRVVGLQHRVAEQVDAGGDAGAHHRHARLRAARLVSGHEPELRGLRPAPRDARVHERRDLHWNSEPAEDLMNQRTQAISDQANQGGGCDGLDGRDDESEASQHLGSRTATTADPELDMC